MFYLYLICIVLWSRISIELVDITKRIGTNCNIKSSLDSNKWISHQAFSFIVELNEVFLQDLIYWRQYKNVESFI